MISYFKLWRLLDKRGYQKKDIVRLAGISESTYRKLLASEAVRMDVLQQILRRDDHCTAPEMYYCHDTSSFSFENNSLCFQDRAPSICHLSNSTPML